LSIIEVFHGLRSSYFLAETLKYLLLMFGSPERMRLDEVVFTTEGEERPHFIQFSLL